MVARCHVGICVRLWSTWKNGPRCQCPLGVVSGSKSRRKCGCTKLIKVWGHNLLLYGLYTSRRKDDISVPHRADQSLVTDQESRRDTTYIPSASFSHIDGKMHLVISSTECRFTDAIQHGFFPRKNHYLVLNISTKHVLSLRVFSIVFAQRPH
jgi:hypothetical protein